MVDFGLSRLKLVLGMCLVLSFCIAFSMFALPQDQDTFLGLVRDGEFRLLTSANVHSVKLRLTEISTQKLIGAEPEELGLTSLESQLILVQGHRSSGWIYSAVIIETTTQEFTRFILGCFPARLVINEIEMNPAGQDSKKEWVELYNHSLWQVSLAGWNVSYTITRDCDSDLHCKCWLSLPPDATIGPGDYYIVEFLDKLRLHNENGLRICLRDPAGTIADATPEGLKDVDDNNETWQRIPNAKDTHSRSDWLFCISTREATNREQ